MANKLTDLNDWIFIDKEDQAVLSQLPEYDAVVKDVYNLMQEAGQSPWYTFAAVPVSWYEKYESLLKEPREVPVPRYHRFQPYADECWLEKEDLRTKVAELKHELRGIILGVLSSDSRDRNAIKKVLGEEAGLIWNSAVGRIRAELEVTMSSPEWALVYSPEQLKAMAEEARRYYNDLMWTREEETR